MERFNLRSKDEIERVHDQLITKVARGGTGGPSEAVANVESRIQNASNDPQYRRGLEDMAVQYTAWLGGQSDRSPLDFTK